MKDKHKTHDLKIDDDLIMLTGNGYLTDNHAAYVLETEYNYPKYSKDNKYFNDLLFENFIVVPFSKYKPENFVERVRPEGFVSNSCNAKEAELSNKIKIIKQKYSKFLDKEAYNFDIEGGLTFTPEENPDCFGLNDAKKVKILKKEVIKRLHLSEKVLDQLLYSESQAELFFEQIEKEMKKLGCNSYTFSHWGENSIFKRYPFRKYAELRTYGYVE